MLDMQIVLAAREDMEEILELQHLVFELEGRRVGVASMPALVQDIGGIMEEFETGPVFKAVEDGKIIGSVRGRAQDGTFYIGKLMVHPEHQKKGFGGKLMAAIEEYAEQPRFELFTPKASAHNIRFYNNLGYRAFGEKRHECGVDFLLMEKGKI